MAKHKPQRLPASPSTPPPSVAATPPASEAVVATPEAAIARPVEASLPPKAVDVDSTPACGNCKHWVAKYDFNHPDTGQCRRYPPTVMTQDLTLHGPRHTFPITHKSASCGEHSPAS